MIDDHARLEWLIDSTITRREARETSKLVLFHAVLLSLLLSPSFLHSGVGPSTILVEPSGDDRKLDHQDARPYGFD